MGVWLSRSRTVYRSSWGRVRDGQTRRARLGVRDCGNWNEGSRSRTRGALLRRRPTIIDGRGGSHAVPRHGVQVDLGAIGLTCSSPQICFAMDVMLQRHREGGEIRQVLRPREPCMLRLRVPFVRDDGIHHRSSDSDLGCVSEDTEVNQRRSSVCIELYCQALVITSEGDFACIGSSRATRDVNESCRSAKTPARSFG